MVKKVVEAKGVEMEEKVMEVKGVKLDAGDEEVMNKGEDRKALGEVTVVDWAVAEKELVD